jgi:hypothetical protein
MNEKKNLDPQHIEYVSTMQANRICCMKNATTLFFFVNDSFLIFLLFVIFGYNGLYLLQYFVWAHKCNFYKKKKKTGK